jgi:hypothetical protein
MKNRAFSFWVQDGKEWINLVNLSFEKLGREEIKWLTGKILSLNVLLSGSLCSLV